MLDFVAEQPYDSIPNFTAADALRLTGVGRNEFIDIMNKCRSKVFLDMIFGSYTVRCSCNLVNIHRFCRGSWIGPQPGGGMHPPSPRGWLPGEVQASLQIYSWSKSTGTLEDLEWFGPPERNTLRPLRVVLLLGQWMSLSSASKPLFGLGVLL